MNINFEKTSKEFRESAQKGKHQLELQQLQPMQLHPYIYPSNFPSFQQAKFSEQNKIVSRCSGMEEPYLREREKEREKRKRRRHTHNYMTMDCILKPSE